MSTQYSAEELRTMIDSLELDLAACEQERVALNIQVAALEAEIEQACADRCIYCDKIGEPSGFSAAARSVRSGTWVHIEREGNYPCDAGLIRERAYQRKAQGTK